MEGNWRLVLPGLGVAFGAAGGFVAYETTGDALYIALGAGLGMIVGAIATAPVNRRAPEKEAAA